MKRIMRVLLALLVLGLFFVAIVYLIDCRVHSATDAKLLTSIDQIPAEEPKRTAIVFGAKVWPDGSPSNSLYDRVITGVELYRGGRVNKLLMSGDKTGENYDEPDAMEKLALDLGVPEADIILDNDGKKTYLTCIRAKEIYNVQKAILVTQDYHQPRALYLCNNLGVDSIGITANRRAYVGEWYYHFREFFSRANAWFEINFLSPTHVVEPKRPIS
jgi:vancomycin permeability regulator SanA